MFLSSLIIIIILKFRENIFLVRPEWLLFVEVKQKKPRYYTRFLSLEKVFMFRLSWDPTLNKQHPVWIEQNA